MSCGNALKALEPQELGRSPVPSRRSDLVAAKCYGPVTWPRARGRTSLITHANAAFGSAVPLAVAGPHQVDSEVQRGRLKTDPQWHGPSEQAGSLPALMKRRCGTGTGRARSDWAGVHTGVAAGLARAATAITTKSSEVPKRPSKPLTHRLRRFRARRWGMCMACGIEMSALAVGMSTLAVCGALPSLMAARPPENVVGMAGMPIHSRNARSLANRTRAPIRGGANRE